MQACLARADCGAIGDEARRRPLPLHVLQNTDGPLPLLGPLQQTHGGAADVGVGFHLAPPHVSQQAQRVCPPGVPLAGAQQGRERELVGLELAAGHLAEKRERPRPLAAPDEGREGQDIGTEPHLDRPSEQGKRRRPVLALSACTHCGVDRCQSWLEAPLGGLLEEPEGHVPASPAVAGAGGGAAGDDVGPQALSTGPCK
mmetsp:Transcript_36578/g.113844  ORF Transcript_36578/g.113844 Transcript_36578/m.113844 type:complete len:200 (+) Transcript_36578:836-1435(+)